MITARLSKKNEVLDVPVSFDERRGREPVNDGYNAESGVEVSKVIAGPLVLDLKTRLLFVGSEVLELTVKEFELLNYLMQNPGVNCSLKKILAHVWDNRLDTNPSMVEVCMYGLRRKLEKYKLGKVIQGVQGVWYRFNVPEA